MKTEITQIDLDNIDAGLIQKAAALIDQGGLVAFPTETVYGIACRVSNDSLNKLNELKNRKSEKYYTLHIGNKQKIMEFVPQIGLRAKKLIQNAWPGPLTIVFELTEEELEKQKEKLQIEVFENLYRDNSIGVRCPDHPVASLLLSLTHWPIVGPSANLANEPPAADAKQVIDIFRDKIPLIIDAGPCKYKKSSTVVKVSSAGIKILRGGVYTPEQIEQMSKVKILFVCTGNSCRSPMAEGMFKKFLSEKLGCNVDRLEQIGFNIDSAGTIGFSGLRASAEAVRVCAQRGIDIKDHKGKVLTEQLIIESDIIYGMTKNHCSQIIGMVPQASEKCFLLGDDDIYDPIGLDQQMYDRCGEIIENAVKKRIGELKL